MKMSEIDHTNSLDPDQAQQNVWQDPKEKGLSTQRVRTKTLLYLLAQIQEFSSGGSFFESSAYFT